MINITVDDIMYVTEELDTDGTVALFDLGNQGKIMNYEGNPDLQVVHTWLLMNGRKVPAFSSSVLTDSEET